MDFQKYLKYKTKYLQQKTFLQQQGGADRITVKVQRIGIVEGESSNQYMFDLMLWDTEAPEELKSYNDSDVRSGYVVWAFFKNDGLEYPTNLNFNHRFLQGLRAREIENFKDKMYNFYIEVLKRAWNLTKRNTNFMAKENQVPLEIVQEQLLSDPSLGPPLTIPA